MACPRAFPSRQSGQALVLALVLALASAIAAAFMFSAGQVTATKQRLVTAADAAAWSAGLWRARVMNYDAYANRAIVFQEVAIAQAVTLAAWSRYFETFLETARTALSAAYPPAAPVLATAASAAEAARVATEGAAVLETWLRGASDVGYKDLLAASQEVLQLSANVFGLGAVANEVAKANDGTFFAFALPDEDAFDRLTRRYDRDEDRQRLKDLVLRSLDEFVRGPRELDLRLLLLPSGCAGQSFDLDKWFHWLRKRGGTTMGEGFDRWEAADTASIVDWRKRGWFFGGCGAVEAPPLGWGAAEAAAPDAATGELLEMPGGVAYTPIATMHAAAALPAQPTLSYSGIARIRELDYERLDDPLFPVSSVSVLARADGSDVRTAERAGLASGRLRLDADFAGGRLWSLSSAQVYFRKRLDADFAGGRLWSLSSAQVYFRKPKDGSGRIEYASLFNPYWQVRLVEPTAVQRALAQGYVLAR